jgi:pimeloyl-ACP methyl ester carboxylesterase
MTNRNGTLLVLQATLLAILLLLSNYVFVLGDEVVEVYLPPDENITDLVQTSIQVEEVVEDTVASSTESVVDVVVEDIVHTTTDITASSSITLHETVSVEAFEESEIEDLFYGTDKSGSIESDEVWDKASGPYHVSDLYIPSGVTITVEAGAEIYTSGYIAIFGKLEIVGSETDKVIMDIEDYADFWAIHVGSLANLSTTHTVINNIRDISSTNGFLDMDYVDIVDTESGIYLNNFATLVADHLSIGGVTEGINLLAMDNSTLNISHADIDNTFGNNGYVLQGYRNSTIKISDSKVVGGDSTSIIIIGGKLDISNTELIGGEDGIFAVADTSFGKFSQPKVNISNSTISDFSRNGIFTVDPDMTISETVISSNGVGIEAYSRDVFDIVMNHSVVENNGIGITYGDQSEDLGQVVFDVRNNFWGDKSGPFILERNENGIGDGVLAYGGSIEKVLYSPWLQAPYGARVPVIIIPGIMGSYLNHDDEDKTEVWPNLQTAFLTKDGFLDDLVLLDDAILNFDNDILTTGIFDMIDKFGFKIDFFNGLITKLKSDGYVEGESLFVFPYDWRLDIADNVMGHKYSKVQSLKDKIDAILKRAKSDKVDIVAHSMGGLLAKYYMKHVDIAKVNRFVDIGTPHLGAPKAAKVLNYGDDAGFNIKGLGFNEEQIKKISQNMPSAYNLLPSVEYFDSGDPDYLYYMHDIADVDGDGVKGRLDYDNSNKFLANMGRNRALLDNARKVHADLDYLNLDELGVPTYNIVGCGTPTIGKILANKKSFKEDFEYHLKYISGDGTVPMRSAESIPASYTYYVNGAAHATMPSHSGVRDLVSSILKNTGEEFSYKDTDNISSVKDGCSIPNGKIVSIHSPVALHIYDSLGNHTGPNENGDIEYGVEGVVYDTVGDNKFAYIPEDIDVEIKINATGTGHVGIDVQDLVDGEISRSEVYDNIIVDNLDAKGEIVITESDTQVVFDKDGTGKIEILKAASIIDGDIPTAEANDSGDLSTGSDTTSERSGSKKFVYVAPQTYSIDIGDTDSDSLVTDVSQVRQPDQSPVIKKVTRDNPQESVELNSNKDVPQSALVGESKIFANVFKTIRDFVLFMFNRITSYL